MGGTYWYFYRMDDDIEFHNSAEPSTTQCPMLPGQIVNVLDMPALLSGNRSRNPSISSTNSEKRTMNPSDKFMNPRPAPTKPRLPRLNTSPTLVDNYGPMSENPTPSTALARTATKTKPGSQPSSATTVRMGRSFRSSSADNANRATSPKLMSATSMRSAFRYMTNARSANRSRSPEADRWNRDQYSAIEARSLQSMNESLWQARSLQSSRESSPARSRRDRQEHDLAFRRPTTGSDGSSAAVTISSFEQHRRQRSRSRTPSSLRNSMSFEDVNVPALIEIGSKRMQLLGTLKEVPSTQNTPAAPLTGKPQTDEAEMLLNLEKRLPTLPNTPSSAYPASNDRATATSFEDAEIENLQSHFSTTTIDTSTTEDTSLLSATTHFSNDSTEYSSTVPNSAYTDTSLIESEAMSMIGNDGTATPTEEESHSRRGHFDLDAGVTPQAGPSERDMNLTTTFSSSTISSTTASSLASSPSQYAADDELWDRPFHKATSFDRFQHQHYRLPADEYGSEVTLKQPTLHLKSEYDIPRAPPPSASVFGIQRQDTGDPAQQDQKGIPHTTTMQQLINELSYLGDMIHQQ